MRNFPIHTTNGRSRLLLLFILLLLSGTAVYWLGPGHRYHFYLMCNEQQYSGVTVGGFLGAEPRACHNEFYPVWQPFQDRGAALATAVACIPRDDASTPVQAIPALRDNLQCPIETAATAETTASCTAPPECAQYDPAHCVCLAWTMDRLKQCGEYNLCPGKAVICVLTGDDADGGEGMLMHLGVETTEIIFGGWNNVECEVSGKGWHADIGSCGTGKGIRYKRCESVWVIAGDPAESIFQ